MNLAGLQSPREGRDLTIITFGSHGSNGSMPRKNSKRKAWMLR